ncbi:hypothetical protein NIES4074_24120 [Cylindrospermum sp. NIES-4074]|nr:hypothetical protein NIES4074_24120 [Cylindrospermum sp. NIES-4074]
MIRNTFHRQFSSSIQCEKCPRRFSIERIASKAHEESGLCPNCFDKQSVENQWNELINQHPETENQEEVFPEPAT